MRPSKPKSMVIALVAAALGLGLWVNVAAAEGPADTIKAFFAAAAKGDLTAYKALTTGEVAQKMPQPGTRPFRRMMRIGSAFKSVENLQIKNHTAKAVVLLDPVKLEAAFVTSISTYLQTKIKDPKELAARIAKVKVFAADFARRVNKFDAYLEDHGGKWKICRLMVVAPPEAPAPKTPAPAPAPPKK